MSVEKYEPYFSNEYVKFFLKYQIYSLSQGGLFFNNLCNRLRRTNKIILSLDSFHIIMIQCHLLGIENIPDQNLEKYYDLLQLSEFKRNDQIELLKCMIEFKRLTELCIYSKESQVADMSYYFRIFESLNKLTLSKCKPNIFLYVNNVKSTLLELYCYESQITSIHTILDPFKVKEEWSNLNILKIQCCNLKEIDSSIHTCRHLKMLDLSFNKIKEIKNVDKTTITIINLSNNNIADEKFDENGWYLLPDTIEEFHVSNNFITKTGWIKKYEKLSVNIRD